MEEGFYNGIYASSGANDYGLSVQELEKCRRQAGTISHARRSKEGGLEMVVTLNPTSCRFITHKDPQTADSVLRDLKAASPEILIGQHLVVLSHAGTTVGFTLD